MVKPNAKASLMIEPRWDPRRAIGGIDGEPCNDTPPPLLYEEHAVDEAQIDPCDKYHDRRSTSVRGI